MTILLAGKTTPQYVNLTKAVYSGFRYFELHLEQRHLDNAEITKENIQTAQEELKKINKTFRIISLHTPHFDKDHPQYLKKTIDLAEHLNAYTILHSTNLTIEETLELAKTADSDKLLIENKTIMDLKSIVHNIIPYHNMALDIAHLYRASQNLYNDLEILINTYKTRIKLIHLNDSTKQKDGLAIGDGDIDFPTIMHILKKTAYNEPIIIETPPSSQAESRQKIEKLIGRDDQ